MRRRLSAAIAMAVLLPAPWLSLGVEGRPQSTVARLSPASGPITGGSAVTITGTGLAGAVAVRFGAVAASRFVVESDSRIMAVAPRRQTNGLVDVSATTAAGTTAKVDGDLFYYEACKVPNALGSGLGGARKRIRGRDCRLGAVNRRRGATASTGTVVSQVPRPGTILAPGSRIRLTLG